MKDNTRLLTEEQHRTFLRKLEGAEGCNFRIENGRMTWDCKGSEDKTFAKRILKGMGIPAPHVRNFLEFCEENGGYCDCEIVLNVSEHLPTDRPRQRGQSHGLAPLRSRPNVLLSPKSITSRVSARPNRDPLE